MAVVGAGLSGSLAALLLVRSGLRVALIDRHAVFPPQFRVEKLSEGQADTLRRLGLLDCVAAVSTPFEEVVNARRGRVIDRTQGRQYGVLYADLVAAVRSQLPASVEFLIDRAISVAPGADRRQVQLEGGGVVDARLVVLATGMDAELREALGIGRRVEAEKHSISFGFSIAPPKGQTFWFPALTYYGERTSDCIDYLNLFPLGGAMRANLFTFRDHRDPWSRELRRDPKGVLLRTLPGLARLLGDFEVITPVQSWVMDLWRVERPVRDGVVLVGDVFQTPCPAVGAGVGRLLSDVERLCLTHAPQWFASPGMAADKIAGFYSDAAKQTVDRRALDLAHLRRSLTVDNGPYWAARRAQSFFRRRLAGWLQGYPQPS